MIKPDAFFNCPALKTIYVPAKKINYYKKRLPEELHSLIVELPAEKSESMAEKWGKMNKRINEIETG